MSKLTQDEMDDIIYDARAGDLENLQETFKQIDHNLLQDIQDEYSLSTPIHMAAANGHDDVLKYLLSLIKDPVLLKKLVNKTNESGNTLLHWALLNGHVNTVTTLCEHDADPFIKNSAGHDAIFEAEINDKEEVENYLLKKFAVEPEEEATELGEFKVTVTQGTEIQDATESGIVAERELIAEKTADLKLS